jgi:hypothetical protein
MGSNNARGNSLAKAVEERGYSCTANQAAFREVLSLGLFHSNALLCMQNGGT